MSEVTIIDSGGANLASLAFALERLGARAHITRDATQIAAAARVILPGVGSAHDAMRRLQQAGLIEHLPRLRQPVLGICLGMQLLYERSQEGATECLGVLPGMVQRLEPSPGLPVPHMGWNQLEPRARDPLLAGVPAGCYMYFVHGYAAPVAEYACAVTEYGKPFAAIVRRDNFWGTQFHPERSGAAGAQLLRNFLELQ
ncbi:MAG TPA: imidazole glycerol phosphate synthase subunit HisH [Steroidobacteraceae bacterium]|nr:imidazole glycerol phosphate synthase subunit HisH [Steroidobacteraceae bacterium]